MATDSDTRPDSVGQDDVCEHGIRKPWDCADCNEDADIRWRDKGRRYTEGHGVLPPGDWLILAGQLKPETGMYWLDSRATLVAVRAALKAMYGEGAFDASNHGIRFYAWRRS